MAFALFLVYFAFTFIRPFEIFPEYAQYSPMAILGGFSLLAALVTRATRRAAVTRGPQLLLVGTFICWCILSVVLAVGWLGGTIGVVSSMSANLFAFYLLVLNVDTLRRLRITLGLMLALLTILSLEGIAAYHLGYRGDELVIEASRVDSVEEGAVGVDLAGPQAGLVRRIRARGFLHDPNDFAQALVAALPIAYLFRKRRAELGNLGRVYVPTAIILYAIALTHSRGGVLALLGVAFLMLRARLSEALSLGLTVVGGLGILAVGFLAGRGTGMDSSAEARMEALRQGILMLKSSPIWGVGYGLFTEHHQKVAHNSYVHCFAEVGLVGYFLWLGILVVSFAELAAVREVDDAERGKDGIARCAQTLFLSLAGFLAAAFFLSRAYSTMLFVLIGLSAALADLARRRRIPVWQFDPASWATRVAVVEIGSILGIYLLARTVT